MKISIFKPKEDVLNSWLKNQKEERLSYPFPAITQRQNTLPGYDHDQNQIYLGEGEATFKKASRALLNWKMFPSNWTLTSYPKTEFVAGEEVAVLFKMFGFWWWNACRIIYVINEENRFGFAYGTLESHVEMGEEIFYIEKNENNEVYYKIEAFSRPNKWFTKLGYPIARAWQARFVRNSFEMMQREVSLTTIQD